jgi:hypothetical protein
MDVGPAAVDVLVGTGPVVVAGAEVAGSDSPSPLHDPATNASASNLAANLVGLRMGFLRQGQ